MDESTACRKRPIAEHYTAEHCYISEWLNTGEDEAVSVARVRVDPGVRTALHRLRGTAERYLILSGHGRVEVAGAERDVRPGDVVRIEPGESQRITNTGDKKLTFLAVCTPRFQPAAYEPLDDE